MRNNSKGFTLIELLAVIVILAIIALITTPVILNVIEDARKNAAVDKAWGTIDAVRVSFAQAQVDSSAVGIPYTVNFPKGDNKGDSGDYGTNADGSGYGQGYINDRPVQASGEMPQGGFVTIRDDGSIVAHQLQFGNYYCSTMTEGQKTELNSNAMFCSRNIDNVTVTGANNDQHKPNP